MALLPITYFSNYRGMLHRELTFPNPNAHAQKYHILGNIG